MDIITRDDIKQLAEAPQVGICVSVYLPTHAAASQTEQDVLLYKNLVKKVEDGLVDSGMRSSDVTALLLPMKTLRDNALFWQHSSGGLAVLNSDNEFRTLRLPGPVGPSAMVADRFVLKPLLPFVDHGDVYYVLALSLKNVRLFRGSRYEVAEVPVEDLPSSLAEALKWDDYEKHMQFFSTAMGTTASQTFYGTGGAGENHKDEVARYFRLVDDAVKASLPAGAPIVLAGVEYLLPIYRSVSRDPWVLEDGVPGSPERVTGAELHQRSWAIVAPSFSAARAKAIERFGELKSAGKASNELADIVAGALAGRIETLFLDMDAVAWGKPGDDGAPPVVSEAPGPGDSDLWDLAAVRTMLAGGDVWAVDPETEPDLAPAGALFRY